VLFELLTGVLYKQAKRRKQTLRALRPDAPEWLEDVLNRVLANEAEARPESAEDFRQLLNGSGEPRAASSGQLAVNSERLSVSSERLSVASLKEALDTAIRLNEWEEAERVLLDLEKAAPNDLSLPVYRKRVDREMQPIRAERQRKAEAERVAKEKAERVAKEKAERERLTREKAEAERLAQEKAARERIEHEKAEKAKREAEELKRTGLEWITIPAGEFLYGHKKEKRTLPAFRLAKYPVTNAQYQLFINANPKYAVPFRDEGWAKPYNWDKTTRQHPKDKAQHPVVLVTWHDAQAYCKWAKCRLPTEEEWEKAARGADGRIYPWGNQEPTNKLCNFNNNEKGTTPVGKYSPQGDSPYGCVDMSGNVWEWTASKYDKEHDWYTLRGGSWYNGSNYVRASNRGGNVPTVINFIIGFRCASSL
jgi:formylglycine-generating enzyme required for sulfatase activity